MSAARVFLSYSHDSPEHRRRVLALAEKLRRDGIDAMVDQYLEPAGPPDGWPRWTETQLRTADFVLAVCSQAYRKRVEGDEASGAGHGVAWEGRLIYQHIYNAASQNRKFIPVLLGDSAPDDIPLPLQGVSSHRPEEPEGYDSLFRTLTGVPGAAKPELGATQPALSAKRPRARLPLTIRWTLPAVLAAAILGGLWLWNRMPAEYTLQVSVLDPNGNPSEKAELTTPSLPATILRSGAGWTLKIGGSSVPHDRLVVVHAKDLESSQSGAQTLQLGRSSNLSTTIRLSAPADARINGIVVDPAQHPIAGARVSIVGFSETVSTDANGNFTLSAHAAAGKTVLLRVEKDGYKPLLQQHPAGNTTAILVIEH